MTNTKYEPREHVIDTELASGNLEAWKQVLGFDAELASGAKPTAPKPDDWRDASGEEP